MKRSRWSIEAHYRDAAVLLFIARNEPVRLSSIKKAFLKVTVNQLNHSIQRLTAKHHIEKVWINNTWKWKIKNG